MVKSKGRDEAVGVKGRSQRAKKKRLSAVYTFHDFGFEEQGAVGCGGTNEFIDHACFSYSPDGQHVDTAQ